jgi:hypothetical protein
MTSITDSRQARLARAAALFAALTLTLPASAVHAQSSSRAEIIAARETAMQKALDEAQKPKSGPEPDYRRDLRPDTGPSAPTIGDLERADLTGANGAQRKFRAATHLHRWDVVAEMALWRLLCFALALVLLRVLSRQFREKAAIG